ncbi:MAG: type I 3-dehydroquinate dehydratase [Clostridiales bacterium]|nr:type I 3-dehydroquinate dehydratase [Clostridiales bacterium]
MKTKPTFLHQNCPLITCMIQADDPNTAINTVRNAIADGCDAFGFQLEVMPREYRGEDKIKSIFHEMGPRPIYVTSYRNNKSEGLSDDELVDSLVYLINCGATLADVMSDFYCPEQTQFTTNAIAVEKQKAAVSRIHEVGGEVLMSAHTGRFMTADEVLRIATGQQERGADISKIVTVANSEEEEFENLRTCERLKHELDIPYIFLCGGSHNKLLRQIGPFLGACMWLTVQQHDNWSTKAQPVCRAIRAIKDSFDYN